MRLIRTLAALILVSLLAACQGGIDDLAPKANKPLPAKILAKMKAKGMEKNSPVYFRLFKDEHVVEVWKQKVNGKFEMIQNYNICAWSGTLGPKFKEGDRQAPEGFYSIKPSQMNPASQYYLSINTGFPNTYDRRMDVRGTFDAAWSLLLFRLLFADRRQHLRSLRLRAGTPLPVGSRKSSWKPCPFRMTPEKMALYSKHKDFAFWQMLKEGYDYFELTQDTGQGRLLREEYVFNRPGADNINAACPPTAQTAFSGTYASYQAKYESAYAAAAQEIEHHAIPDRDGRQVTAAEQEMGTATGQACQDSATAQACESPGSG